MTARGPAALPPHPVAAALAQIRRMLSADRAWWAVNDPVAFAWLCRAERRGAIVPWTKVNDEDSTGN